MSKVSEKIKNFYNTKIVDQSWEIKYKILTWISGGLIVIWYSGMFMQLLDTLPDRKYTMFLDYGLITLTFFGFTLIGGIFEDKEEPAKIKLKLFDSSLNFLITSIAFFVMYSVSYFLPKTMDLPGTIIIVGTFLICLPLAFIGMISGIIKLLRLLINYRIELKNQQSKNHS